MNAPETTPLTDVEINILVRRYVREMARYEDAARLVEDRLRRELREYEVRALLSSRAKHPDDLRGKLAKNRHDPRYAFASLDGDINDVVTDLAGCRIMVYRSSDVAKVEQVVRDTVGVASRDKAFEQHNRASGYRATHFLVGVGDNEERISLRGALCEVQITSLAAHVFNELEHDIRYKDREGPASKSETSILEHLLLGVKLVDSVSEHLLDERAASVHRRTVNLKDGEDLRFALEHAAGRPLRGEFALLFDLLNTAVLPLTAGTLANLGAVDELLARGKEYAEDMDLAETATDDVIFVALSLFDMYADAFEEVVLERGGPDTLLSKAVHSAAATRHVKQGLDQVAKDRMAHQ